MKTITSSPEERCCSEVHLGVMVSCGSGALWSEDTWPLRMRLGEFGVDGSLCYLMVRTFPLL